MNCSRTTTLLRLFCIFCTILLSLLIFSPVQAKEPQTGSELMINGIINESYNFLKNREPEMTDTEYALYEKVVPMALDRPDFALTLLETMIADEEPESPAFSFVLANVYYAENKLEKAEQFYRKAVEDYPQFLRAWINLGILYYTSDEFRQAIPCFTQAIQLGNSEAQIRGLLGYCLQRTNNPLAAEAAFLQALAGDPDNPDWIEALLSVYLESEQYQRAELLTRQLIRLDPENAKNWQLYASILTSQNRELDALTILENGSMLGLLEEDDYFVLADLYARNQLYPEACEVYRTVMKQSPERGSKRLLQFARTLVEQSHLDEASEILNDLESGISDELKVEFLIMQTRLHLARNELEEAQIILLEILKLDPLNGEALFTFGKIHRDRNEPELAQFYFEQSRKLPDFSFLSCVELANLALMDNHYQRSIELLKEALRQNSHPELEQYLIKIQSLVVQSSPSVK